MQETENLWFTTDYLSKLLVCMDSCVICVISNYKDFPWILNCLSLVKSVTITFGGCIWKNRSLVPIEANNLSAW